MLYITFNQDYSCFGIGTEGGFIVMDTDPLSERFKRDFEDGGIGIIEMLYKCNIIALVGGGKNPKYPKNKVMIWDDIQAQCIAELEFSTDVCGVRLRRDKIFVILETKIYIYNFGNLKLVHECIKTYSNPKGICSISQGEEDIVMACLGEKSGEVKVFSWKNKEVSEPILFPAHENAITQLTLNRDGSKLATASERGTLIRIFDTSTGERLKEFRRGTQGAQIYSLCFNSDSTALCTSSDTGTVHIYHLTDERKNTNKQSTLSFMKKIVPILGSTWSSRQISIQENCSICCFGTETEQPSIIVLGASGRYYKYVYSIDPDESEECKLIEDKHFFNGS